MNKFSALLLTGLYLTLTACGGSGGSANIFEELEKKQSGEGRASLARTPDSILGYWTYEESLDVLFKVEKTKLTLAVKCPEFDYIPESYWGKVDEVSMSVQLISEDGKSGGIVLAENTSDYYFCGTNEMTSDFAVAGGTSGERGRFLVEGYKLYMGNVDDDFDTSDYLQKVSDL